MVSEMRRGYTPIEFRRWWWHFLCGMDKIGIQTQLTHFLQIQIRLTRNAVDFTYMGHTIVFFRPLSNWTQYGPHTNLIRRDSFPQTATRDDDDGDDDDGQSIWDDGNCESPKRFPSAPIWEKRNS